MVRFCSAVLLALLLVLASPEASITASGPDAPPVCTGAVADVPFIWPPTDEFLEVHVVGVTDDGGAGNLSIEILSVTQDEPLTGTADALVPCHPVQQVDGTVLLRYKFVQPTLTDVYRRTYLGRPYPGPIPEEYKVGDEPPEEEFRQRERPSSGLPEPMFAWERMLAPGDPPIRRIDIFLDSSNTVTSYRLKPKPKNKTRR